MQDFLKKYANAGPARFHMPGHKGGRLYSKYGYDWFLHDFLEYDITEILGAGDLFAPQDGDIIRKIEAKYAKLYDARDARLMINGTSGAIIAGIMATVPRGGKLICTSNCHRCVLSGAELAGAEAVMMKVGCGNAVATMSSNDTSDPAYGTLTEGAVPTATLRETIAAHPDATAVLVTSPNYNGVISDIYEISKIVHDAGMLLIIDEAHGAHLKFFSETNKNLAAEDCGADIVCLSTHKTLASMTQSAVMLICSDRVDVATIDQKLRSVESSSPSYILMASLDINADMIEQHGREIFANWQADLDYFYSEASRIDELELLRTDDPTKIIFRMGALERELNARGIWPERVSGEWVLCLTGIGNTRSDYERLIDAIKDILST